MKVIFFNGPPRSGKDTSAKIVRDILREQGEFPLIVKFSDALKNTAHTLVGLDVPADHFETTKDFCNMLLPMREDGSQHMSPREFYIFVSERMVKPHFGNEFWGRTTLNSIKAADALRITHLLVADSGFSEEAQVFADEYGFDNCHVVRLSRDGCSFEGDSRSYWSTDFGVTHIDNSNGIDVLKDNLLDMLNSLKD